jgi:hypothetical protein
MLGGGFGDDKTVDAVSISIPPAILRARWRMGRWRGSRFGQWPERPPLPIGGGDGSSFPGGDLAFDQRPIIRCSVVNPGGNEGNRVQPEFGPFIGHVRFLRVLDEPKQPAGFGLERDHRHAFLASFQQALPGGDAEFAFGLFAAVTFEAMLDQQPPDLALECFKATRHFLGVISGQRSPRDGLALSPSKGARLLFRCLRQGGKQQRSQRQKEG